MALNIIAEFLGGLLVKDSTLSPLSLVTDVARVQPLDWKLLHATGVVKKRKKNHTNADNCKFLSLVCLPLL